MLKYNGKLKNTLFPPVSLALASVDVSFSALLHKELSHGQCSACYSTGLMRQIY